MESAIVQGSDEFKGRRFRSIGSSDAPVVVGVSDYALPKDLLMHKRRGWAAGREEESEDSEAMRIGRENEERIGQLFARHFGTLRTPCMFTHPEFDYMTANPDRLIRALDDAIVEIKCLVYVEQLRTFPRIDHIAQVHHQMDVCLKKFAYIIYGLAKDPEAYVIFLIPYNEQLGMEWVRRKFEFWGRVKLPATATAAELAENPKFLYEGNAKWGITRVKREFKFQTIVVSNGSTTPYKTQSRKRGNTSLNASL